VVLAIQGSYSKMAAFATSVQKNITDMVEKTASPPLKICERVTLAKFLLGLM
jgi:hypothetical protein